MFLQRGAELLKRYRIAIVSHCICALLTGLQSSVEVAQLRGASHCLPTLSTLCVRGERNATRLEQLSVEGNID